MMKSKLIVVAVAVVVAVIFGIIASRPDSAFSESKVADAEWVKMERENCKQAGGTWSQDKCKLPIDVRIVP